ncbi:ABC transporter ATP-binding protein [Phytoactinopolyspora mesophila]|uniref:ATP-binding cassette domain-containing protein n=1 Tax=Phytoactinopolyspora mesophila TaxID=2650750 RepID=A0A7K3M6E4_9ACTN|nr:ABC transporter ATP-binding protein [Phytoactinopolyspora mesophila]NDL58891.1 ATP-binding cassette domain-containing protein [Phytoactinopolyspora mesophila]
MRELEFRDLTVRFGTGPAAVTAVDGVSLKVPAGSIVGLVGESGSGKSTLAKAAVGLAPMAGGQVLLDGAVLDRSRTRRKLQMVFQDPYSSLDPRMTIGDSIAEAIPERRSRKERRAELARLLELVDLDPARASSLPSGLSGGQRQRVALARALAAEPEVILADEITSALDVSVQGAVLNLVRDLQRRLGLSILFISHNLAVVRYVSDIIAVMYLGRIVEAGPASDVLNAPRHPYTRTLLDAAPRIGTSLDDAVPADNAALDQDPPSPHEPPPGCAFHRRCPYGPLILPSRTICADEDPHTGAQMRPHRAACHFAGQDILATHLEAP